MPSCLSKNSSCKVDTKTSAKKIEICKRNDTYKTYRLLLHGAYWVDFYRLIANYVLSS